MNKRTLYNYYRHHAALLGRTRAIHKLDLILAWLDWHEARENLALVNGRPKLQGVAMRKINRAAGRMGRAWRAIHNELH